MKVFFLFPLAIVLLFILSCKKNEAGGKAEIKGRILHHSAAIANAYVYIKYDSKEFPGKTVTDYDTYVMGDGNGNYSFKCYKGDYFLYAIGIDSLAGQKLVEGGVPVHIRSKEVVKADIAVTDQH